MKNILFIAFLMLSVSAFGQTPDTKPRIKIYQPPSQDANIGSAMPLTSTIPPLLVVDSVITHFEDYDAFQNKLQAINPNDIQSIDVLKDKMAIEKYGEKGLHGVIVVTLKKVEAKRN